MTPPAASTHSSLRRGVEFLFGQAGLVGGICAALVAILGIMALFGWRPKPPKPDPPMVTFQKPAANDPTTVPGCIDVQFKAELPDKDHSFLIGVYIPERRQYVFEPDPEPVGDNIWARRIALGSQEYGAGKSFRVILYLVESKWVNFGKATGDDQDGGTWSSVEPPPDFDEIGGFDRTRSSNRKMNC
jgi:hypothetical protein